MHVFKQKLVWMVGIGALAFGAAVGIVGCSALKECSHPVSVNMDQALMDRMAAYSVQRYLAARKADEAAKKLAAESEGKK